MDFRHLGEAALKEFNFQIMNCVTLIKCPGLVRIQSRILDFD